MVELFRFIHVDYGSPLFVKVKLNKITKPTSSTTKSFPNQKYIDYQYDDNNDDTYSNQGAASYKKYINTIKFYKTLPERSSELEFYNNKLDNLIKKYDGFDTDKCLKYYSKNKEY